MLPAAGTGNEAVAAHASVGAVDWPEKQTYLTCIKDTGHSRCLRASEDVRGEEGSTQKTAVARLRSEPCLYSPAVTQA
jgi:hypothetical protein